MAHPQIAVFARLAKGGDAPRRVIFGQETKLSRTMHDIRYSHKRDEMYVTNPFAQAILAFSGDSAGSKPPIRVIQGPKTKLGGIDTLEIDDVHDEILVPNGDNVLVFPIAANGDVAPLRILQGGDKVGWEPGSGIAVDNVHHLLVTDGTITYEDDYKNPYPNGRDSIFIFDRTAQGDNVKPLRTIRGDKTGIMGIRQMQVWPKGGWIIISQITDGGIAIPPDTYVGVWSIYDNGNVPPRWRIDGKASNVMLKPRGVALNPNHKELIVSDMRLNAVLTFSFPEIFDQVARPPQ
ncbi:MAG TPA: hypothetical protein VNN17_04840 [Terriglobia bacterium]|nr:hypothetical protein [Terriglobia bacterium]